MLKPVKIALVVVAVGIGTIGQAPGIAADVAGASAPQPAAANRAATLEDFATKLEGNFYSPDVARKYAAMLRSNAASGKYDAIADDKAFANQVTEDLQAIAFDGHLKLVVPHPAAAPGADQELPKAIQEAARLTPGIAYIRLGRFFGEPENIAAIVKFLRDNSDAKTLIIDMRTHIGGGLDEMNAMFPLLFDKETTLVDMDTRKGVDPSLQDTGPGLREVPGPEGVIRQEHFIVPAAGPRPLARAKIFVLTSGRTGSAGEHFVLSMKRTHRATIIGDTTYGAGNFGNNKAIAGGFSAFIPVGRTFDPDTGKGWDYVGVAPNIAVPAAQALTEALVRSGVSRAQAEALSAKYGPPANAVSSLRKAGASVAGI